jgi:hypothetical protein
MVALNSDQVPGAHRIKCRRLGEYPGQKFTVLGCEA